MTEHAVIVKFYEFADRFWTEDERDLEPLFNVEDQLIAALDGKGVGELDGHEIAVDGSDGFLFLYGPDADALYAVIEPVLRTSPVTIGGDATLRFGASDQPNVYEKYVKITRYNH